MHESIAAEMERLRAEIRAHDRRYYVEAQPTISDAAYDHLLSRLRELEAAQPELVTPDSPTQRVGGEPVRNRPVVAHRVPMLSIENTYDLGELRAYGQRVAKLLPGEEIEWVVELKIDGVATALTYENGLLVRAATRGNGREGDDVTHNVRTMRDVPLRLCGDDSPPLVEIRGEVYIANSDLVALNEQRAADGKNPFANTRNLAAGTITADDPREAAERRLRFFGHGLGDSAGLTATTHEEYLAALAHWGIPPTPHARTFGSFARAVEHCETLIGTLHELDFEIDGLVLKVNRFDQRARLGTTSKSPRWLIAYKFEKYEATTRLRAIRVQVGKTGAITPVADLEPVELAGTIVSRASLHNADEIARKDVREGDAVVVEKAGKIIPHIVRVEKHLREGEPPAYAFPTACPECGMALVRDEGGVYIRCPNPECPAQLKERIRYFAGRNAMDIEGLGDKLVDQLVERGLVRGFADLYRLRLEQLAGSNDKEKDKEKLKGMGQQSSENVLKQIAASRTRGLARLLAALSIRHVGVRVAAVLAERFGSIDRLAAATEAELSAVNEVGPVIARTVAQFFASDYGRRAIEELSAAGVVMTAERKTESARRLEGKTLVVTGTLHRYSRDAIERLIAEHGGRAASSVSKNTDYLVAGEKAGSKLEKARALGVAILDEDQFEKLVTGEPPPS